MRAFLGIQLPEAVRASLQLLQRQLASSGADVKWVEPQDLHITVKFLEEISDTQREAIDMLLRRLCEPQAPYSIRLGALGAFPSLTDPRVIWVGLTEGAERVKQLVENLEREGTAIPREVREYTPHITLGRVRSSRHCQALIAQLQTIAWQAPASWRAETVTFYQSQLSSAGPRYTVLADVPFGEARRVLE